MFPQAFIATGEDITFTYTNDVWEYNYYSDAWVQRNDFMGPGRSNAISFVLGDVAFVGSGYGDGMFMDDMYAYRPLLSVDEIEKYNHAQLYPNPSNSHFSIEVDTKDLTLHVFGLDGKEITGSVDVNTTNSGFYVEHNSLSTGSYLIRLEHVSLGNVYQQKVHVL